MRSIAQVPRCYTRLASRPDGLQLELLWNMHVQVMAHVIGRGAYSPSASRPGPIAARFASIHGAVLATELQTCVSTADDLNLAAATQTVQWFYGLLHSSRNDETLPREVAQELHRLRGSAVRPYAWPASMLKQMPAQTDASTQAAVIQALHHGMMSLVLDAVERKDDEVVSAVSEGVADLYQTAARRLSDIRATDAARQLMYDHWILLGHFVTRAIEGVSGTRGAVETLHKPFQRSQSLDLMNTFLSLPEATWNHPLYARQRLARGSWITTNPVSGIGTGAFGIGHPGGELSAAFAFLVARSWRILQPKPDVVPCSRELGEAKKRLNEIFATPDAWQLSVLDQDKAVIHQWLDDYLAAHRALDRQRYMDTPLSADKLKEFEQRLRTGFWQHAVLLELVPGMVSADPNAGDPLKWCALRGSRSL